MYTTSVYLPITFLWSINKTHMSCQAIHRVFAAWPKMSLLSFIVVVVVVTSLIV